MPIYEYTCSACGTRTDILHGINDGAPNFCPDCGAEGSLRKAFAPPAIVFKGSGWARKDRSSRAGSKSSVDGAGSDGGGKADGAAKGEGASSSDKPAAASSGGAGSGGSD
jgi:putative FmdB family regulatory protein